VKESEFGPEDRAWLDANEALWRRAREFSDLSDSRLAEAARRAGGIWIARHLGMQPPIVWRSNRRTIRRRPDDDGLESLDDEYPAAKALEIDGVAVRVLPLVRIIASKRAANRPKDQAALPALEAALAVTEDEEGH
jgi:hypothetical protein